MKKKIILLKPKMKKSISKPILCSFLLDFSDTMHITNAGYLTGIFCGSQVPRVVFVWGQCWYWDQFIWNLWAKKHYWWSGYTTSRADAFESGNTGCRVFKLERFLPKNQQSQRKLLNFENLCNGELSKIGQHFSNKVI